MVVYLVTSGDGTDGDEWQVNGIFTTLDNAMAYINAYNAHRPKWARLDYEEIECWPVDVEFDPKRYPHDPPKNKV